MNLEVTVVGADDSVAEINALRDWLDRARLDDVVEVSSHRPPTKSAMGLDPSLIPLMVSAPALTVLARSIQTWLTTRQKKIEVIISTKGKQVAISTQSVSEEVVKEIIESMK
jgi:hypothetical protein